MSDNAVLDFNSGPFDQPDLDQWMRDWAERIRTGREEQDRINKKRRQDPNWEWQAVYIRYGDIGAYTCHKWVWVGEGEEPK